MSNETERNKNDNLPTLLTAEETAKYFNVSTSTLKAWNRPSYTDRSRPLLSFVRIGRRRYYLEKDIVKFINNNIRYQTISSHKLKGIPRRVI